MSNPDHRAKWKRKITAFATLIIITSLGIIAVVSLDRAKRRAESINCRSNMISIGLAARLWANDHGDVFPSTLSALSNELNTVKVLFCPTDRKHPRPKVSDWSTFNEMACSYQMVTPAIKDDDASAVFMRCKVHGHLGYGDGSVFYGVKRSWDKGIN